MRADQALVARGLAPSRSAARRLIDDGAVHLVEGTTRTKVARASHEVRACDVLEVSPSVENRYVSRAGSKLAGALAHSGQDCTGVVALDVGQSTGGFTDCLLQAGAARVVGVDVGHGQLAAPVRADPRVTALEGLNARALTAADLGGAMPAGGFDLVVADVSFISLTKVLPAALALAAPRARLLALVKPQFELGPDALDGRGVVRDPSQYRSVQDDVTRCVGSLGWRVLDFFPSGLPGGDGNREFFVFAQRDDPT